MTVFEHLDLKNKIKKTFVWNLPNNHNSISLPTCVMLSMLNLLVLDYNHIQSSASLIFPANLKTIQCHMFCFFLAKRCLTVVYRRRNTYIFPVISPPPPKTCKSFKITERHLVEFYSLIWIIRAQFYWSLNCFVKEILPIAVMLFHDTIKLIKSALLLFAHAFENLPKEEIYFLWYIQIYMY